MKIDVKFSEMIQEFKPSFGAVQTASDGGFERGYAKGYEQGNTDGYTKGHTEGVEQGYSEGYAAGEEAGVVTLDNVLDGTITVLSSSCSVIADYALRGKKLLTAVNFPNATTLGIYAMYQCVSIQSVDLPKAETLNNSSFGLCSALETVILRNSEIVSLKNANCFTGTPIASGTGYIYVPDDLVDTYKAATNWSTYADQIKPLSELEGDT